MRNLLRLWSLAFLAWHGARLVPDLADPVFMVLVAVVGWGLGSGLRRLRGWVAVPAGAAIYGLTLGAVSAGAVALAGWGVPGFEGLPLWFDRQAPLGLVAYFAGYLEGWIFTGRVTRQSGERLANGVLLAAIFWSQGPYHVTFYAHPVILALVVATFLAAEIGLLVSGQPRRVRWAPAGLIFVATLAVLWALLGRYEDQSISAGGGLMKPDLFQFDFSPLVRLESEIALGDKLVLLYREDGPVRDRYLRRLVLDTWRGDQGFSVSGSGGPTVGRKAKTFPDEGTEGRSRVNQEYFLVNIDPASVLALNSPSKVEPFARWDRSSFVNAYRVQSQVSDGEFWLYNETPSGLEAPTPPVLLSGGDDPEIRALARSITKGTTTDYERAEALVDYFHREFTYSLKPGTPGPRGALKHFLFESRKGYCSYFAFGMTLMLRSLGIPARVAVGFATDSSASVLGFTPVRGFQAHAWVEVPFGKYGWIEFDPTSSAPTPGEDLRFPPPTDPDQLSRMIAEILQAHPTPLVEATGSPHPENDPTTPWWSPSPTLIPWIVGILLIIVNESYRYRWKLKKWRAAPRQRILVLAQELKHRARRIGLGPRPGETPEAWATRIGDPDLERVASEISRARYSDGPFAPDPAFIQEGDRLIRSWDRRRPRRHRILSLVFPWWPR